MVNINDIKDILNKFDEISINNNDSEDDIFISVGFEIKKIRFIIFVNKKDFISNLPLIMLESNTEDYPHIMLKSIEYYGKELRYICLTEKEELVKSILSFEDKISLLLYQLIRLLNLSKYQLEDEFQKEFLYYWNSMSVNKENVEMFLNESEKIKEINIYRDNNNENNFRFVCPGIQLSDKKDWSFVPRINALYIPIIDNRGILPPTQKNKWRKSNILSILDDKQIKRLSFENYDYIKKYAYSSKTLFLIFNMYIRNNSICFVCAITFKGNTSTMLLEKLRMSEYEVDCITTKRSDYEYLNMQIGNDICSSNKKIAIIGAGSLGSYLANEIVKSGFRHLTIYDDDILNEQNILRHSIGYKFTGCSKVEAVKKQLESIHPEIMINAVNKRLDLDILNSEMTMYDAIIFTVGSSDIQLACNKFFINKDIKVLYSWLEGDGINSHILFVDYKKAGCFECLFTSKSGQTINNKANIAADELIEERVIRNGCGGTRVAYGTEILLRTTSIIINTLRKVLNSEYNSNFLIDISSNQVSTNYKSFYEQKCRCCNVN